MMALSAFIAIVLIRLIVFIAGYLSTFIPVRCADTEQTVECASETFFRRVLRLRMVLLYLVLASVLLTFVSDALAATAIVFFGIGMLLADGYFLFLMWQVRSRGLS